MGRVEARQEEFDELDVTASDMRPLSVNQNPLAPFGATKQRHIPPKVDRPIVTCIHREQETSDNAHDVGPARRLEIKIAVAAHLAYEIMLPTASTRRHEAMWAIGNYHTGEP